MAYTLDIADAVQATVGKFVTLNTYQVAGHVANLEFWKVQVKHALVMLDGYDERQRVREHAQREYIRTHDTRQFFPGDLPLHQDYPEHYPLHRAAPDRHRIDVATLQSRRREIADGFYRFLRRCHTEGLLSGELAKQILDECGIGLEPGDFRD